MRKIKNDLVNEWFFPYDPEQTYFSTYFNVGLIGFIFFISLYFGIVKRISFEMKKFESPLPKITGAGIEGSLAAFLGYHYTLYSVVMLFTISSLILYRNKALIK